MATRYIICFVYFRVVINKQLCIKVKVEVKVLYIIFFYVYFFVFCSADILTTHLLVSGYSHPLASATPEVLQMRCLEGLLFLKRTIL